MAGSIHLMSDSLPFSISFDAEVWSADTDDVILRARFPMDSTLAPIGPALWEAEVHPDQIEDFDWQGRVHVTIGKSLQ